jgi:Methyltransferase domain
MSLINLPISSVPKDIKVADLITSIPGMPALQEALKYIDGHSLVFRALSYVLIRMLRPQLVVEIGTLNGGTSELFAQALMANGQGILTTVDPYGGDRVPAIIRSWASELSRFVDFRPINSMELFAELAENRQRPDLIFVDGNHEYEYALFDLLASARSVRPEGIIIMDNYDLPGVIGACKSFEADNPTWQPVRFCAHPSFGSREDRMRLDGLLRIYVAPSTIPVSSHPVEFFSGNLLADGVRGFRLELAEPSPGGRLHYQIYLRIYPWNLHLGVGDIEELSANGSTAIPAGETKVVIDLSVPLRTSRPLDGYNRRIDIGLLFEDIPANRIGGRPAPLLLADEPVYDLIVPAPADRAAS